MKEKLNNDKGNVLLVEYDISQLVENSINQKDLSKEQIAEILKETKESIDFVSKINEIELNDSIDRVIFTDGETQLVYINGEFFEVSTTDSTKKKKKKKKQEAKDMYLEYFIKYQLNPLLEQSKNNVSIKTINTQVHENLNRNLNNELKKSVENKKVKVNTKAPRTRKQEKEDISR